MNRRWLNFDQPLVSSGFSVWHYVNPLVAVLLGITFAGERIGPEEWLAMTVIVSAVILIGLLQWRLPKVAAVASET